ncbi:Ribosomal protein L35Ae [Pyrolobus fumarii 1A]|uniref:Large ribosomal subunit protein eL33 n=1 Tax=Pyrolobus fumarii (strain DSM 11204 / 1A) TaxID=694429 RepID=G0ED63_PYRF1|nr:50S ribosomal protein L35ae [Pyrolobus fumarii]AEM39741.1 Ribosomal protein L35Ae [Pyrolobus fumarii 1A]
MSGEATRLVRLPTPEEIFEKGMAVGVILGYRMGGNEQYENQVRIKIFGINDRRLASRLIGWKVIYRDQYGNEYRGKVIGVHGNRGVVLARFKPNLPGQAITGLVVLQRS